jgi:hypothetical protein
MSGAQRLPTNIHFLVKFRLLHQSVLNRFFSNCQSIFTNFTMVFLVVASVFDYMCKILIALGTVGKPNNKRLQQYVF